jgi:hypothetical protein
MKNIVSTTVALLLIFAGFTSCKKDKLPPKTGTPPAQETPSDSLDTTADNCGCGDNHSVVEKSGTIYYKISAHHADTSTHHKFWITSKEGSIYIHRIVCNKVLPSNILKLKEDNDTTTKLNVIFSGNWKLTCKDMIGEFDNGSQLYYNIVLTKIEVQ